MTTRSSLLLCTLLTLGSSRLLPASTPPPDVKAASVVLIDARTGEVLYQRNPDERRPVASTQKLLTSLIVAEQGNLEKPVVIDPIDEATEPTTLQLKPGTALFELPRVTVMGGWHRFHLQPRPGTTGGLEVEISKKGRDLDVTPRVVWGEGASKWLPQIHVTLSPLKLTCTTEDSHPHPDAALELWDNFRVIRMYRAPLLEQPPTKGQD